MQYIVKSGCLHAFCRTTSALFKSKTACKAQRNMSLQGEDITPQTTGFKSKDLNFDSGLCFLFFPFVHLHHRGCPHTPQSS